MADTIRLGRIAQKAWEFKSLQAHQNLSEDYVSFICETFGHSLKTSYNLCMHDPSIETYKTCRFCDEYKLVSITDIDTNVWHKLHNANDKNEIETVINNVSKLEECERGLFGRS